MKKRRFFSVFLCIVMIMTMIPAFSITASAASATEISDIDALKTALEAWGPSNLKVTKDLKLEVDQKIGTWCTIKNSYEKVVDLNGHSIYLYNKRNDAVGGKDNIELMFKVTGNATLTIKDTSSQKNGYIYHDGHIDDLARISIRNVVEVDKGATLNLESGTIKTGDYKNVVEWGVSPVQTVSKHIWGTGVIVNGGVFNMYGGLVEGSGNNIDSYSIVDEAGIKSTSNDSMITIFDGKVVGYNGAPALYGTKFGKWLVMNGKFQTAGSSDTYIWGMGPYKMDAAPVGITAEMVGNWSQFSKFNKTPVFESTDVEVMMVYKDLKIVSQTTTADLGEAKLSTGDYVKLKVSAVGGKGPYSYLWQIKRSGDSDFRTLGDGPRKDFLIGNMDNGAQFRCIVTDAEGAKATTDVITLNAKVNVSHIRQINVDVYEPEAGRSPAYKATSRTTGVSTGNVRWFDAATGKELIASDKYQAGGKYRVEVYVFPSDSNRYQIDSRAKSDYEGITINQNTITGHTLTSGGAGWIVYEFPETYVFPFEDVYKTDWFYESVKGANKMGLINGMTPTIYAPEENTTYAQAIKLAACMNQKYYEGKVTLENGSPEWYDSYVDYCLQKGIINQNYASVIDDYIDRQTYASIFANALPAEALTAKNSIPDNAIPDVKSGNKYYKEIYTLYRAGICNGNDEMGTFNPYSNIKRSEVAAILIRMMDPSARVNAPSGLSS